MNVGIKLTDITVNTFAPSGVNAVPVCQVSGCAGRVKAKRLCLMHYRRLRRHGDAQRRAAGRKPIDEIIQLVARLFKDCWSPRTRQRYIRAWRLVNFADGDFCVMIAAYTRPNGTIDVNKLLQRAEDIAALAYIERQQS